MKKLIVPLFMSLLLVGCKSKTEVIKKETTAETIIQTENATETINQGECAVYVCGAVANPGVYYLPSGSRKQEALVAAGGLVETAATSYVNLAEMIKDGERIYFPYEDELGSIEIVEIETDSGLVNINTANKELLMTLSGIGESRAVAIIEYREEHGPFSCIEDICLVNGIKEGLFNKIKDSITVN